MISAVFVVYNEEKVIRTALESIKGLVDEILVVHDGPCTDKTLEICHGYGAKTFERPYQGNAEPHRPWLYEKAKGPWILQLDADESLSAGLAAALPLLTKAKDVAIYELVWPTWNGERYITHGWPHKKALFRKDRVSFLGLPHCEVLPNSGKIITTHYILEHKPNYDNFSWKIFRTKWKKWVTIHANWIARDPKNYSHFPKNGSIVLPRYYSIKNHPVFLSLPLGVYQGLMAFTSGGYRLGLQGLKVSFMIFCYWVSVGYFVAKQSH